MADVDQPGKIFIGGLNIETKQKTLHILFRRFGPIAHVILKKDRETKKSRGFAFITFQHPADAKNAVKEMNGVSLDGKKIKVEQAKRPSFESVSRRRTPSFSRTRDASRFCERGESSRRRHPSREGNFDDDGHTPNYDMSISRRHFPVKRSLSSKSEDFPSKRSVPSAMTRSSTGLRERESYGREISRNMPKREPVPSRRDEYPLPRDDGRSSKDSYSRRSYPSSRDTKEYASTSRGYRDYSSRNEHASKVFSDHAGYSGGRDRDYSEYSSGSSYRDTYESYGSFREAASTRGTYSGNSRYDDNSSSQDGYGGSRENYSSSRSDTYSRGYERGGRQGVLPPIGREYAEHGGRQRGHSPMDRLYSTSHESYSSSSRFEGYSGGHGESRYESGGRY